MAGYNQSFYCQKCSQTFTIKASNYDDFQRIKGNGCPSCGCVNVVQVSGRLFGWVPKIFKSSNKGGCE